jgi:hypothetical protein
VVGCFEIVFGPLVDVLVLDMAEMMLDWMSVKTFEVVCVDASHMFVLW